MRTDHVNHSATSPHHLYFFPDFFPIFFIWNYKIYHIWQFLVFIPVTGFQCHSVLVNSGDCSGEITGISKFRGRSEILAGKFHWNGTGIRRNDRIPAGICGASLKSWSEAQAIVDLRPILVTCCRDHKICGFMVVELQRYENPWTCGCRYARIRGSIDLCIYGIIWQSMEAWAAWM